MCDTIKPQEVNMSKFMVNLTAINLFDEQRSTLPIEVMVDTGVQNSWLPRKALEDAGITPKRKKRYMTAGKRVIERDVGHAILSAEGFTANDEVVFAEENDLSLLGVRTIEGFHVMVDNSGQRFVDTIPTV
jgi:predicted aspartyl protease